MQCVAFATFTKLRKVRKPAPLGDGRPPAAYGMVPPFFLHINLGTTADPRIEPLASFAHISAWNHTRGSDYLPSLSLRLRPVECPDWCRVVTGSGFTAWRLIGAGGGIPGNRCLWGYSRRKSSARQRSPTVSNLGSRSCLEILVSRSGSRADRVESNLGS